MDLIDQSRILFWQNCLFCEKMGSTTAAPIGPTLWVTMVTYWAGVLLLTNPTTVDNHIVDNTAAVISTDNFIELV